MTSSGEAIRRTPRVATIDHRWTAPLWQKLNDQRILKQCCCRFREMGSKTTLKAWYVKRLPTVAHVAAWLINSQATNHHIRNVGLQRISYSNKPGACQAQKRCSKSLHNFTKRRTPFWGPKKRGPFGGPFSMLTLRAIPFPIWNPKKGSIFPPQNWGFFFRKVRCQASIFPRFLKYSVF